MQQGIPSGVVTSSYHKPTTLGWWVHLTEEYAKEVSKDFGVDCTGYLNAYTLAIAPAEGGAACP